MIPGTRIEIYWPAGPGERFGPDPLATGQFFTFRDESGEAYRARLESFTTDKDGAGLSVVFEIIGRYGDASLIDPHPYPVYKPVKKVLSD